MNRARMNLKDRLFAYVFLIFLVFSPLRVLALQEHQVAAGTEQHGSAADRRESGEQDEMAPFRHSASVQLVAKLTGLGLENAYWLCVVLNFAVIAGMIIWVSKKNLPGLFRQRSVSIQKAMDEAKKSSQEANQRLSEIEARLSRLGTEIENMQASAEKESAAEEERIRAAAEEDARKVVRSAEEEIAAAAVAARRELKAYAADLAVSLASQQIQVDAATDKALIRNFANQLSKNGAEARKDGA